MTVQTQPVVDRTHTRGPGSTLRVAIDMSIAARAPGSGIWRYLKNIVEGVLRADPEIEYTFLVIGGSEKDCCRENLSFAPPGTVFGHVPLPDTSRRQLQKTYRDWIALPTFLDRHGFDLFHGQYQTLPRCRRTRVVTTLHDLISFREHDWKRVTRLQTLYRKFCLGGYRRADGVICSSDSTRRDLSEFLRFPEERAFVAHLGVDELFFQDPSPDAVRALTEKHRLPPSYILYVGDLSARKNVITLVRAYARLKSEISELPPIVLCGKAWFLQQPELIEAERLGVSDCIHRVRGLQDEELLALYKGAAFFVFPSLWEGFGFPPLEAMAAGVPVVCSNRSSLPELVGDAGIMCDPRSDEQFAAAMRRLLHDPEERRRLAAAGPARARQFTWERTGREVARVYRACADADPLRHG